MQKFEADPGKYMHMAADMQKKSGRNLPPFLENELVRHWLRYARLVIEHYRHKFVSGLNQLIGEGLHKWPASIATLPQPSQTYFIAASLSLQICLGSTSVAPQKLHLVLSPQGLHKCPGSFATAPQFLHVYAMVYLLWAKGLGFIPILFL